MTTTSPQLTAPPSAPEAEGLTLRSSRELQAVPTAPPAPGVSARGAAQRGDEIPLQARPPATNTEPWLLLGLAALACGGWLLERRRRRRLETEKDSVLWAGVQPPNSSIITTAGELDDTQPESAASAARASSLGLFSIGETTSRREATLIDLHQLDGKLRRRRARGDILATVLLLQQHVADFRYTSPWVFLELRELHHLLGREQEWELAREAFRVRFGQKAPLWQAPSTAEAQLVDDVQICGELVPQWPYREARMVIMSWMMGDLATRDTGLYRPPVLALGVYRDLLFIDRVLDRMMIARPPLVDSLL